MDRRETVQRTIILEQLNQFITQLLTISTNKSRKLSQDRKATVYRNVNLLVEDGLLRKICIEKKKQSMIGI